MSGKYVMLEPGRYTLAVSGGEGPAGVQRHDGSAVRLGVDGGRVQFAVDRDERAYYWWRGPEERLGVRLLCVSDPEPGAASAPLTPPAEDAWSMGTAG